MNLQQIQDRLALKDLVDTFSNLADEKKGCRADAAFHARCRRKHLHRRKIGV